MHPVNGLRLLLHRLEHAHVECPVGIYLVLHQSRSGALRLRHATRLAGLDSILDFGKHLIVDLCEQFDRIFHVLLIHRFCNLSFLFSYGLSEAINAGELRLVL